MTIADELQKLQQLHESGALSEEEFQRAKEKLMGEGPEDQYSNQVALPFHEQIALDEEGRNWAMWLHLSCIFPVIGLIFPIVLWQSKVDKFPGIAPHGRMVLNWAISIHIYSIAAYTGFSLSQSATLGCCLFAPLLLIALLFFIPVCLVAIAWPIIGAIQARGGKLWKYRWAIPFFSIGVV
jgi:uncharacterized Tic20 family protein